LNISNFTRTPPFGWGGKRVPIAPVCGLSRSSPIGNKYNILISNPILPNVPLPHKKNLTIIKYSKLVKNLL